MQRAVLLSRMHVDIVLYQVSDTNGCKTPLLEIKYGLM